MSNEIEKREVGEREKRIILRGVKTKSVRELAEETGLTVEQVLTARQDLLDSIDVLSIDQQVSALLVDLMRLQQKAEDAFDSSTDERSKAPLLSAAVSSIKLTLAEIRKIKADSTGEAASLNALRQREIIEVFRFAFGQFSQWLESEHGIDKDVSEPKYMELLQRAASEMEERNDL